MSNLQTLTPTGPFSPLAVFSKTSLTLTLLLCGGYAGMVLLCQIGLMPALEDLSPGEFAKVWHAMDVYMARRMPPYKGLLLLLNGVTLIALAIEGNRVLATAAALSLLFSGAGLLVTVRGQLPLTAQMKSTASEGNEDLLRELRSKTAAGFRVRLALAVLAFAVLSIGAVLSPLP